jgi:hypothetical protein
MRVPKDTPTFDVHTGALYSVAVGYVAVACIIMLIQPFLSLECDDKQFDGKDIVFGNNQYGEFGDCCCCRSSWRWIFLASE